MRKIILCFILCVVMGSLLAQGTEDWLWGQEQPKEDEQLKADFIQVNYEKKDARLAMLMSMIVPGAGQFYADKSAFTAYLFPALEIGMVAGILYFNSRGNEKTKDFEHYATGDEIQYTLANGEEITTHRYERNRQHLVESILMNLNPVDIYEDSYFRLEDRNSQHFYEDIGKYAQYVFGWADWYYTFATDEAGHFVGLNWYPGGYDASPPDPSWVWAGNYPIYDDPDRGFYTNQMVSNSTHSSSPMRKKYVELRNEAKSEYSTARLFTFGLAVNHLAAGLDAIRVTRKANRGAITDSGVRMQYYTGLRNNQLTPSLSLNWKF
jgi:hypothetical protein